MHQVSEEYLRDKHSHGKYQFACLAYGLLSMTFDFFNIRQINQAWPKNFAIGLSDSGKNIKICLGCATGCPISPIVYIRNR